MKKILLSLFAVFTALSLSAKEDVTDAKVFKFEGTWNWQTVKGYATGDLITDETNKTVDDKNLVYTDMSQYDYLVVAYAEATTEVRVILQYSATGVLGQWGAEFYQGDVTIGKTPKPGIAVIALDKDHKNKVNCVALQNSNSAGEINVTGFYFATEAEYQAALDAGTVKYGEPKTLDWTNNQIRSAQFDGYSMDAKVEFVYNVTGDLSKYPGWGMFAISSLDGSVKVGDVAPNTVGENTKVYYLSELVNALNVTCEKSDVTTSGLNFNMYGQNGVTVEMTSVKISEQEGSTSEIYKSIPDVSSKKDPLYVIGNINDASGWHTNVAAATLEYDKAKAVYTGTITVTDGWEGNGWFAIGTVITANDEDWNTFNAERLSVSSDWGKLGEAGTLVKGADASFKLPVGTYVVTVDLTAMTVTIVADKTTAISNVNAATIKVGKFIENGKVVIYNNGQKFNVAGQLVK